MPGVKSVDGSRRGSVAEHEDLDRPVLSPRQALEHLRHHRDIAWDAASQALMSFFNEHERQGTNPHGTQRLGVIVARFNDFARVQIRVDDVVDNITDTGTSTDGST